MFKPYIETVQISPRRVTSSTFANEDKSTTFTVESKVIDAHDFGRQIVQALEATDGPDYKALAEKFTSAAFGVYCASITARNFVTDESGKWLLIREDDATALIEAFNEARDAGLIPSGAK